MKVLVALRAAFFCSNCGDLAHLEVPVDGRVTKSYCCGAKYRITSDGLKVTVKRVKKKKKDRKE